MADDVTLNTMTGGSVVATDEITSRHFQKMKMTFGADGTATDVSASNPYPVTVISIAAGDNNIGNVDIVSSALPSGAATSALQTTGNTALSAIQTAVEIIDNAISGTEMQVDIVSSALPTGAATEASLSSLNGKVTACNTGAVVVSSSALPSGASTAAKQPALGTAGTASADVITVQGIASMTALKVDGSAVTQPVSGTVAVSGTVTVGSHAVTNAGTFAVQVTSIAAGDNNIGNVDVVTLPALPTGSNVIGAVTQSGTWNVGTVTTLTGITNALPAGTNAIGKLAANSGVDIGDVDVTSISAGGNLIGDVGLQGRTTGGLTYYKNLDVDETEDDIKTSAGTLYWLHVINLSNGKRYLKFYDSTAASVTVGTTTPVLTLPIPTQGDTNGAGFTFNIPQGIAFSTGICIAATTGFADADTGAPGANEIILNAAYK